MAFGGVDLKVGDDDDDEREEEEEYDEDVLWASRLAMASKIEGNYVGDEHHSWEDGSITLKYIL